MPDHFILITALLDGPAASELPNNMNKLNDIALIQENLSYTEKCSAS